MKGALVCAFTFCTLWVVSHEKIAEEESKCETLKGDDQDSPVRLDNDFPDTQLTLFPNLTILNSGIVSSIKFFAVKEGPFYVSFWQDEGDHAFRLVQKIEVSANDSDEAQTFIPQEEIVVEEGVATAIHYESGTAANATGVISYGVPKPANDDVVHGFLSTIMFDDGWDKGKLVSFNTSESSKGLPTEISHMEGMWKYVALHVEICPWIGYSSPCERCNKAFSVKKREAVEDGLESGASFCPLGKSDKEGNCETFRGRPSYYPRPHRDLRDLASHVRPDITIEMSGFVEHISVYVKEPGSFQVKIWKKQGRDYTNIKTFAENARDPYRYHTIKPTDKLYVTSDDVVTIHFENGGEIIEEDRGGERIEEDREMDKHLHDDMSASVNPGKTDRKKGRGYWDFPSYYTSPPRIRICTCTCAKGYDVIPLCGQSCSDGEFGPDCEYECTGNCLNNEACNKATGWCDSGCPLGYQPPFCIPLMPCSLWKISTMVLGILVCFIAVPLLLFSCCGGGDGEQEPVEAPKTPEELNEYYDKILARF